MGPRKTLIRSQAGVNLKSIKHLDGKNQKVVQSSWRLSTFRAGQPQSLAGKAPGEDAFDVELIASLSDFIILKTQRHGLID